MNLSDFEGKTWSEVRQWVEENQMLILFMKHGPEILKTYRDYGPDAATAVLSAYCHLHSAGTTYTAVLAVKEYQKLSNGKLWRDLHDGVAWLGTSTPPLFSNWAVDISELSDSEKGGFLNVALKITADQLEGVTRRTIAIARLAILDFLKRGMTNASAAESSHEHVDA